MSNLIIYVLDQLPTYLIPNLLKSDFLKLGRPSAEVVLVEESDFDPANFDSDVDLFRVSAATLVEMERNFFNMNIWGSIESIKPYIDFKNQKLKADFKIKYVYDADDYDPTAPMVRLDFSIFADFKPCYNPLTFDRIDERVLILIEETDDFTGEKDYLFLTKIFAFKQFMEDIGWETDKDKVLKKALVDHLIHWVDENKQDLLKAIENSLYFNWSRFYLSADANKDLDIKF